MNPRFKDWLEQRSLGQTYLTDAKRIDREYGDLDEHYERDRLESLIRELQYTKEDQRRGRPNPSKLDVAPDADLYQLLSPYRSALRRYCEFRAAMVKRWDYYLEEARRRIADGTLDEDEEYKRNDLAPAVSAAREDLMANHEIWPTRVKGALTHSKNNLVNWRSRPKLVRWIEEDTGGVRDALLELWADDDRTPGERIRAFDAKLPADVFSEGSTSARLDAASYLMMGLDPDKFPPCRLRSFRDTYKLVWYPEPGATGAATEYEHALRFLNDLQREASKRGMDRPNTRLDAQSVVWTLKELPPPEDPTEGPLAEDGPVTAEPVLPAPPKGSLNTILYGPPGTGKTYATVRRCVEICDHQAPEDTGALRARYGELVDEGRVEFVTFHQSYGYEEFVEGLRPAAADVQQGGMRLDVKAGVLKRIAERARGAPCLDRSADTGEARAHVLVIDEINRANISKVMGELITLLEEDKREGAENEVAVTLPYSRERFTLPANLHILGTMNTADRSIALLDTALRRRFRFEEMSPDPTLLGGAKEMTGVDLPRVLQLINERLEYLVDRDHLIGHAWFMDAETREDVDAVMRHKIIPLIAEYFYDDWGKVRAVLGGTDHFVKADPLGAPPGLDIDTGEERYRWTVQAAFAEDAYERLVEPASRGGGTE